MFRTINWKFQEELLLEQFLKDNGFSTDVVASNLSSLADTPIQRALAVSRVNKLAGDIILKQLLAKGYDPFAKSTSETNAFHVIATYGLTDEYNIIMHAKPAIAFDNEKMYRLINISARASKTHNNNYKHFINFIVKEQKFPIDYIDHNNCKTLVMLIAEWNLPEVVQCLLDLGANPLVTLPIHTFKDTLDAAARAGSLEVVQILFKHPIIAEAYSSSDSKFELVLRIIDNLPLEKAKSIIKCVIDLGLSIDHVHTKHAKTLLMAAAILKDNVEFAQYLLELGANTRITYMSNDGLEMDASSTAAGYGAIKTFKTIMGYSLKLCGFHTDPTIQYKFLKIAIANMNASDPYRIEACKTFIQRIMQETNYPIDYKPKDNDSITLLASAVLFDNCIATEFLLCLGADPSLRQCNDNVTIAQIAACHGSLETFKMICSIKPELATFSTQDSPNHPLAQAVICFDLNPIKLELFIRNIVSVGYPLELNTFYGHTALIIAALNNRLTCAKILIELGANINYINLTQDVTPFLAACNNDNHAFAAYILQHPQFEGYKCVDQLGRNIVHHAALSKSPKLLHAVCEKYPALINIEDNAHYTALETVLFTWALSNDVEQKKLYKAVISELLSHEAVLSLWAVSCLGAYELSEEFEEITHHIKDTHIELLGDVHDEILEAIATFYE